MEKVVKKKRKRRRRKKVDRKLQLRVRIMSFCMICAAIAGVAIWYFGSATVSLAAMTKISLVGYDSKGWVKAEMDGSSVQEEEPQIQQVLDTVEISFSKEENLSNGEQIEIQYSYDEELAKELGIHY